jgi:hypothetical protein
MCWQILEQFPKIKLHYGKTDRHGDANRLNSAAFVNTLKIQTENFTSSFQSGLQTDTKLNH